MLDNGEGVTGSRACAIILGEGCGDIEMLTSWTIDVPGNKPPVVGPELPPQSSPKSKVLHITDIHLDLDYTLGNAGKDCGATMCCHVDSGIANGTDQEAGYWGDNECDVPEWTYRDMLMQIRERHPVSYCTATNYTIQFLNFFEALVLS